MDANDPAFQNAAKPIGSFMGEEEAMRRRDEEGWDVLEDAGRGWRRVVASPQPKRIIELDVIKGLLDGMDSRERRQQCRMHVDDRIGEPFDGLWGEDPHESGKHHCLRSVTVCGIADRRGELVTRRRLVPFDHDHGNACSLRSRDPHRI